MADSFNGYNVYEVTVEIKGEYTKMQKHHRFLKFLNKPKKPIEMKREIVKLIVANSRERAPEKYKDIYIYPEIGGEAELWNRYYSYDYYKCKVTSVTHDIGVETVHSIKYLSENLTTQDFVQYMTFLGKGFNELIEVNFKNEEE